MRNNMNHGTTKVTEDDEQMEWVSKSQEEYTAAAEAATAMPPTDPLRLSIALNHSVC